MPIAVAMLCIRAHLPNGEAAGTRARLSVTARDWPVCLIHVAAEHHPFALVTAPIFPLTRHVWGFTFTRLCGIQPSVPTRGSTADISATPLPASFNVGA